MLAVGGHRRQSAPMFLDFQPLEDRKLIAHQRRQATQQLRLGTGDRGGTGDLRELGGDDFLGEVIDAFLGDAPELIATLRRSLEEQNTEELRRSAHTLKSNGATLGAEEFAELCRTLEQRAKAGELDGASELVDRIEREYRPLEEALCALRSGSPS